MRLTVILVITIGLLLSRYSYSQSQFDYASYENISLGEYLKTSRPVLNLIPSPYDSKGILITNPPRKLSAIFPYSGKLLDLDEPSIGFLQEWVRTDPAASNFASLYGTILEVQHDDIKLKLPIQTKLVPYLQKELVPGNSVRLYFIHFGWVLPDTPMFLITEFEAPL